MLGALQGGGGVWGQEGELRSAIFRSFSQVRNFPQFPTIFLQALPPPPLSPPSSTGQGARVHHPHPLKQTPTTPGCQSPWHDRLQRTNWRQWLGICWAPCRGEGVYGGRRGN